RAQAERNAGLRRGARQRKVGISAEDAVHACRGDDQRRAHFASEQLRALVTRGGFHQCVRHETPGCERGTVAAQAQLVLRSALEVLESEVRNATPRDFPKVRDVECALDVRAAKRSPSPGHVVGPPWSAKVNMCNGWRNDASAADVLASVRC